MEAESAECEQNTWLMDSGVINHYSLHREWFVSYQAFANPVTVYVGNNSTMSTVGKGEIDCEAWVNGKWLTCHINDVMYVPNDRRNLMSFAVILDKVSLLV